MDRGSLLHIGCGSESLPTWLSEYKETRLDIDEACKPDIVASMTALGDIGEFDVVFCQHALEHLYPHEVPLAVNEFLRVLKTGGYALVFVPDLEDVKPTDEIIVVAPSGPITGLDMYYGYAQALREGNLYMAHKCGFVSQTLKEVFVKGGFTKVEIKRLAPYNLMGIAIK